MPGAPSAGGVIFKVVSSTIVTHFATAEEEDDDLDKFGSLFSPPDAAVVAADA
jgi:hypothetical protein